MPLIRITARDGRPVPDGTDADLHATLRAALPDKGPVVIMIHGYKYEPGNPLHCPHTSIFSQTPDLGDPRIISWPKHLGFRGRHQGAGLAISFGWSARGTFWQAHDQASVAGDALAELLTVLRRMSPSRSISVIAHSLGARVTLKALAACQGHAIDRAILLAGAEFNQTAAAALSSPAGQSCDVLNVTSRENDLFDFLIERVIAPPSPSDRMLGHGTLRLPNLVTLQLDNTRALSAARRMGFPIAPATRRICHWSPYTRPGVFPLYRAVLDGRVPLADLAAQLPTEATPRWSRLFPIPRLSLPLSFAQKTSV